MNDLKMDALAVIEYLENSIGLAELAGRKGPATSQDAAALGQLYALIAIAIELKRANDWTEGVDVVSKLSGDAEGVDPLMPPDVVWEWLPQAQYTVVDRDGGMYWYGGEVEMGEDEWYPTTTDPMGRLGNRDLGDADWRTTKRTRPAHL